VRGVELDDIIFGNKMMREENFIFIYKIRIFGENYREMNCENEFE